MNRGFTLIETLIYIALLAFIMGSGVVAAFYVIDSSEKEKGNIHAISEAAFLMRKIDWALNNTPQICSPASGMTESSLLVDQNCSSPINPILIDLSSERAQITIGGAMSELTSEWVKIENLQFEHIAVLQKPAAIKASFTANGKPFEMTKYLRK